MADSKLQQSVISSINLSGLITVLSSAAELETLCVYREKLADSRYHYGMDKNSIWEGSCVYGSRAKVC